MLNLDVLRVFLAVAKHGSFSEAGRRLYLSQPAVSQTIQGLERQLGVQLFIRHSRTAQLTESGQALVPMARDLLDSAQRVEQTMVSFQKEVIGEITIGCSTASGKYLLPGLIGHFHHLFSQVRINVMVSAREVIMTKLFSGEIALGISSKKVEHPDLEYQDFFTDPIVLIVPANHPWAGISQIMPADLLDEPLILREESSGTREALVDGLRQDDISVDMLNIAMVLGNTEAIEMAVEEGLGVAFVSRLAAARGVALGRVIEVNVTGLELTRNIYLTRNTQQLQTRVQVEFWEFVNNAKDFIKN
ncbi:MAG: selenium metabolism-associated LysR family transcriptional regulator [Leptolinea sp.]